MGNSQSIKKVNYEDMQMIIKTPEIYLLINTLSSDNQECLILNTIPIDKEEAIINKYIKENQKINIIIYGKNCNDQLVDKKYQQLILLGYVNVIIYSGGLFEWLLSTIKVCTNLRSLFLLFPLSMFCKEPALRKVVQL